MAGKERHDAHLLFPVSRQPEREEIGIGAPLPFWGVDIWTAYELSWLNPQGKPEIAMGTFCFPADSPHLIESKSLKLYLHSFNQVSFKNPATFKAVLEEDLSRTAGSSVEVRLKSPEVFGQEVIAELPGASLDRLEVEVRDYAVDPNYLAVSERVVEEALVSNLLRTNCPITGQPDWAGIQIRYRGPQMDRVGLLRYLVSFRQHQDFHENCVERIFMDLCRRCSPERLTVYARYTRRGGIEINPFRSNYETTQPGNTRTARQ